MNELKGQLGARLTKTGTEFGVFAPDATAVWICLFEDGRENGRHLLERKRTGIWSGSIKGVTAGQRYGIRADGPYNPALGHWFDPHKLLVDPFATRLDSAFRQSVKLAAHRAEAIDTSGLVPKAIVEAAAAISPAHPVPAGGLIYELNVRAFTMRHPDIPEQDRGTLRALRHPAIIAHLAKLGIDAVELMPVAAWIDEPHLGPLGLSNAWGYNPVTMMAPDPRLAPGGIDDLRDVCSALGEAGIGVILDLVFNHTGESDAAGPTLSLRGLANNQAYRHDTRHHLINDTGTGNTLACDHPFVMRLVMDSLRAYASAGVAGFRFDLATVLGRTTDGFSAEAPLMAAISSDSALADRMMIAEPWDIGHGGYQLGRFPTRFLEWNDRFRDGVRQFWRGDGHKLGTLATVLAGSSDVFAGEETRSVNFVAAHDGFALADVVSYSHRHNGSNGEENRDGHGENFSWNNGVEGHSRKTDVRARRKADVAALLASLFASRGTIMLTAGDEFGRTQNGNNNAYAQDNETTWLDWVHRDTALEDHVAGLAQMRRAWPHLSQQRFFTGEPSATSPFDDVEWLRCDGAPMEEADWHAMHGDRLAMLIAHPREPAGPRLAVLVNRARTAACFTLPARKGFRWQGLLKGNDKATGNNCPARGIAFMGEIADS